MKQLLLLLLYIYLYLNTEVWVCDCVFSPRSLMNRVTYTWAHHQIICMSCLQPTEGHKQHTVCKTQLMLEQKKYFYIYMSYISSKWDTSGSFARVGNKRRRTKKKTTSGCEESVPLDIISIYIGRVLQTLQNCGASSTALQQQQQRQNLLDRSIGTPQQLVTCLCMYVCVKSNVQNAGQKKTCHVLLCVVVGFAVLCFGAPRKTLAENRFFMTTRPAVLSQLVLQKRILRHISSRKVRHLWRALFEPQTMESTLRGKGP